VGRISECMEMRNLYTILVRTPGGKIPFCRYDRIIVYRKINSVKRDFKDIFCERADWSHLSHDRAK
jgi:hypothetical protein